MSLRLKDILKDRNESISAFASKVGITQANMSNIVNGKSSPTLDTLERIAFALNVPITELFSTDKQALCGHVEYKGIIYRINSFEDLEKVLKLREE